MVHASWLDCISMSTDGLVSPRIPLKVKIKALTVFRREHSTESTICLSEDVQR